MAKMVKKSLLSDQRGNLNPLLIPLILAATLLIGAAAFGVWAYGQRQDYKDNVNQKIVAANAIAVQADAVKKDKVFAEELKNPLKTYSGPVDYGSVQLMYPKTWSAYVDERGGSAGVDGYLYPSFVPSINDQANSFALRIQVLNTAYDNVLQQYTGQVKQGKITSVPYKLPKLDSVVGVRLDGALTDKITGSMVIFPLRDKTIKLWTESTQFQPDFNNIILPNFTFSP